MGTGRTWRALCAVLCTCVLGSTPGWAQSGGIEIFSGETLFGQGTRISAAYLYDQGSQLYRGSDQVADPDQADRRRERLVLGYNYGLAPRITIGALLPLTSLHNSTGPAGSRVHSNNAGIGDTTIFGKFRLHTTDKPLTSSNLSFVCGVETPTGETGLSGPQPGSGSWDPFGAFAYTHSYSRWRFDSLALFKANTQGTGDLDAGDEWSFSTSAGYRYLHRPYPGASNSAKIGLLWQSQGYDTKNGARQVNSGSERLYLRPSLGFHPNPAIDLGIAVEIPLQMHYSGAQVADDYRLSLAWGYRFQEPNKRASHETESTDLGRHPRPGCLRRAALQLDCAGSVLCGPAGRVRHLNLKRQGLRSRPGLAAPGWRRSRGTRHGGAVRHHLLERARSDRLWRSDGSGGLGCLPGHHHDVDV